MRCLVTGAGSGIGRATAQVLTDHGHDVVATARRPDVLDIAPGMKGGRRHGEDGTPYEELRRQWSGADDTLVGPGGRPAPELVGEAIAAAVADTTTPLRIPVGADAEMVLAARRQLDDDAFHQSMRELLGLSW